MIAVGSKGEVLATVSVSGSAGGTERGPGSDADSATEKFCGRQLVTEEKYVGLFA